MLDNNQDGQTNEEDEEEEEEAFLNFYSKEMCKK